MCFKIPRVEDFLDEMWCRSWTDACLIGVGLQMHCKDL